MKDLFGISQEEMIQAYQLQDMDFVDRIFIGDLFTGSFCRINCSRISKESKRQYFNSASDAIKAGFYPCSNCQSILFPDWMKSYFTGLTKHSKDKSVKHETADIVRVNRWMKKNLGMAANGYERLIALNRKFSVTSSDDSFNHLSYKSENSSNLILLNRMKSPLGTLIAGIHQDKLCLLEFSNRRMLPTQLDRIHGLFSATITKGDHPILDRLQIELDEYFDGERREFSIPLVLEGSKFQNQVWNQLLQIPYGQTTSYAEQSEAMGKPFAIRAMARANGDNRICILVPCHRVIGSDGSLTGYGGGLWRKKYLLDLENKTVN